MLIVAGETFSLEENLDFIENKKGDEIGYKP